MNPSPNRLASPRDFEISGELPGPGVTMLEASAGTGKTYAIAALVTRFVAAGTPISDMLIVTFTVAATGELRKRVRDRLVESYEMLERRINGDGQPERKDEVLTVLAAGTAEQLRQRCTNISRAIADFDSATITTTHGFCDAALSELGLAGDAELRPEFETDLSDLAGQVATDLYVASFSELTDGQTEPPLPIRVTSNLVIDSAAQWDAQIMPQGSTPIDGVAGLRVDFAQRARERISHRKRLSGKMTFSDQIDRLARAVADPERGHVARRLLRERYPIVLIDEFQDTDTSQWDVLKSAFGNGDSTLLLIGDPKQAIYAFRGADIYAYLGAAKEADNKKSLTRNFRTDEGLVAGLNRMFGALELGDESIKYRHVSSAAPVNAHKVRSVPLRFRMTTSDTRVDRTKGGAVSKDPGIRLVSQDVAADIVSKLQRGEVAPRGMAVLVGRNKDADEVRKALHERGVPAVIRGSRSVFSTQAADDVKRLLLALDKPSSTPALRRLALSDLVGFSAHELAVADDHVIGELSRRVSDWAADLERRGISGVFARIKAEDGLLPRLLGRDNGERTITDLDQIVEIVHEREIETSASAAGLATWLTDRITEADSAADSDERARRLESDAEAVQVITIHAAKGLEFDVVYCPFLWCAPQLPRELDTYYFHDDGKRMLFLGGGTAPGYQDAKDKYLAEMRGEGLRQAYVAMTRARHELVVWWVRGHDSHRSPLAGVLSHIDAAGTEAQLQAISEGDDRIGIEYVLESPKISRWDRDERDDTADLVVNKLGRDIDARWGRTSFSGLTSVAHESTPFQGAEPDVASVADEADDDVPGLEGGARGDDRANAGSVARQLSGSTEDALRSRRSLFASIAGGTTFGSFVHTVFEHVNFAAKDLRGEVEEETATALRRWAVDVDDLGQLCAGIQASIETPLGADLGNIRLADVSGADRLDEMDFEYELAGGNSPTGDFNITAVGSLLDRELSATDPLRGYLPMLANPALDRDVHGYLSGSIDLVLRSQGDSGQPQFSVVDYKTNRLGGADLSAWDYRPDAVERAVFSANYPVQFLLYNVALHRLLRVKLPGYDPAVHLGPVKYLFVRGMFGANNPVIDGNQCGVYSWQPPANLVVALSELIATGGGTDGPI
ncbi:MAG: UvrD-helicase domain-containing protein [Actinobacteria bacterium]|nr:UvrD-helicase domain-containing protein [Actinomycetota bacterium]